MTHLSLRSAQRTQAHWHGAKEEQGSGESLCWLPGVLCLYPLIKVCWQSPEGMGREQFPNLVLGMPMRKLWALNLDDNGLKMLADASGFLSQNNWESLWGLRIPEVVPLLEGLFMLRSLNCWAVWCSFLHDHCTHIILRLYWKLSCLYKSLNALLPYSLEISHYLEKKLQSRGPCCHAGSCANVRLHRGVKIYYA